MIEYKTLTLIGTSHISPESITLVRKTIQDMQPSFVALELDQGRLYALLEKKRKIRLKDILKLGIKGSLFALVGAWVEKKLGKMVGTTPGGEMKTAVVEAAHINAKVVLIDQDISVTIQKLFKRITWKEKFRFLLDLVKGVFGMGEKITFDLRKVPPEQVVEKLVAQVKKRYPSVYYVLIEERNSIMARKLSLLMKKHPEEKIVAVVGAGHEKSIITIIEKIIA